MNSDSLNEAFDIILKCREGTLNRSYIQGTLCLGEDNFLRKLGKDASEVVMACKDHKYGAGLKERIEEKAGDLFYSLLLAMADHEVTSEKVFQTMWEKRQWKTIQGNLSEAFQLICDCRDGKIKNSHIKKTLRRGDDKILRKIGEEASEVVMACKDHSLKSGPKEHVEEEIGDVFYYLLIAMAHHELGEDRVFETMWQKYQFEEPPSEKPKESQTETEVKPALVAQSLEAQDNQLQVAATPEYPDRPLALNSAFYIQRPPIESDCYQEILQPGSLIRIKGPKNMGKTSLLNRILSYASDRSLSTVRLNLQQVEGEILANLDKFLRWLSVKTARQLQLQPMLDQYWDEEILGSMESCTAYFQEYLLEQLDEPLVLGLDAVERLFECPEIAQDFFALMRVWHEEANNLEIWQRLRLVVVHSTEVYIPLKLNQSPFNVGMPVKLPEFTREQIQELAQRYGLDWNAADAEKLKAMVGGHPYLVELALYHLKRGQMTLEELLKTASTQAGIYSNYLSLHLTQLQENPELATAFKRAIEAQTSLELEPASAYKLESLGLVQIDGNAVKPSCELYRQYFRARL